MLDVDLYSSQYASRFMNTKVLKELESTRAKVAVLEKSIESERTKELAGLPAQYGFKSTADFLQAVRNATGGKSRRGSKTGRRTRAVITDATRAKVKALAKAGKTGTEIAAMVGISLPSVQNIKKALGLVKPRSE